MNKTYRKPMRSVWQSLLWKEWHQHKWKLLGLVVFVAILMFLSVSDEPLYIPMGMSALLLGYGIIAGLLLGMSAAAGENGRGTMPFLQALPISMRRPAVARILMSLITILLPIVIAIGIAYTILVSHGFSEQTVADILDHLHMGAFRDWQFSRWLLGLGFSGSLLAVSFLTWFAALGVNRSDEIRAGALAFLAIATGWLCVGVLAYKAEQFEWDFANQFLLALTGAGPGGAAIGTPLPDTYLKTWFFVYALLGHAGVIWWYVSQYGRRPSRPRRTLGKLVANTDKHWLAAPRRSQLTAMIWKQLMQTGPLAVGAAGAVVAMTALYFWLDSDRSINATPGEVLAGITMGCGFMITIVAGMGVFMEDVKPQINIFWRSRPVDTTTWFWTKFCTGLVVLAAFFSGLIFVAALLPGTRPLLKSDGSEWVIVAYYALVVLLIYCLSMACYCWTRQPTYAVLLTLSLLFGGLHLCGILIDSWMSVDQRATAGIVMLMVSQVIAAGLAWYSIRSNRSWQG